MRVTRAREIALTVDQLDIGPGVTAVVGPNGSGKSTLLHAVSGLLPASGTIEVLGAAPHTARPDIAYVLQAQHASEHLLITSREVVALARAAQRGAIGRLRPDDRDAISSAMKRLEVSDLARRHLGDMSGGQRQRVFVAQGLAQDADVLLLDEPVAGLDLASTQGIRRIIEEERNAGRTVVLATHDLASAARADMVVLLNGTVVASGSPSEVLVPAHLRTAYGGRVLDLGDGLIALDDDTHH